MCSWGKRITETQIREICRESLKSYIAMLLLISVLNYKEKSELSRNRGVLEKLTAAIKNKTCNRCLLVAQYKHPHFASQRSRLWRAFTSRPQTSLSLKNRQSFFVFFILLSELTRLRQLHFII